MADKHVNRSADIQKIAKDFIDKKITDGVITPDGTAAAATSAVPTFSAGTVALDPNTGRPDFSEETPAPDKAQAKAPESIDAEAGALKEAASAGKAEPKVQAETPPRDDKGKFKTQAQDVPAPASAAPAAPATREAQVEDAAAAILDEWADAAELEFEHDDGSKYKVRTPKAFAKQVERFNQRQAIVNKKSAFLDKYRPTLEPLITSGQLDPILPILNRALQSKEFADFVTQAYNRSLIGQPLAPQQAPPVVERPAAQPPSTAAVIPEGTDPFLAEQLSPIIAPLMEQNRALQARLDQWTQQQEQSAQQHRQEQANAQHRQAEMANAHKDLALFYPQTFSGDLTRDQRAFDQVVRYARDSGLVNTHGIYRGMLNAAAAMQADRADLASPAAQMLAQVDNVTLRAAQAQAAGARSVSGGSSPVPAAQPKPLPKPPATRDEKGRIKSAKQMMAENQAYAQAKIAAGA